jgi:hypothetical protein
MPVWVACAPGPQGLRPRAGHLSQREEPAAALLRAPLAMIRLPAASLAGRAGIGPRSRRHAPVLVGGCGRRLHPSLTFARHLHAHGESPPPAPEGMGGPYPPSASLSKEDEERVNGEPGDPPPGRPAREYGEKANDPPGDAPRRSSAHKRGRRLYPSLTFAQPLHAHGGSPPPPPEGMGGPCPPSASLSREDEERVNGAPGHPPLRSPATRHIPAVPGAVTLSCAGKGEGSQGASRAALLLPEAGLTARIGPRSRGPAPVLAGGCGRRLLPSLTFAWQAHAQGGNPPPRPKRLRGPSPPSAILSRTCEEEVNGEPGNPLLGATGTRRFPRSLRDAFGLDKARRARSASGTWL